MKKLVSKALVGGLVAASAVVAAPAQAQTHPCYLHTPVTAQHLLYCACVDVAEALSPVVPPSTWNCDF